MILKNKNINVYILYTTIFNYYVEYNIDTRGVMVIVVGNGHGDTSSNPGRDWLHFT